MSKNTENTLAEETVSTIDDRRRFYAEQLHAEIPASWNIQNIGNLCSIRTGKLDVNQADEGGNYPFFTCAEKIYRINTFAFDAEAVLVAGNGFFNVKYYNGKFNAYQRTYVLSDIKTDAKYLYYYIDYRLRDITGESRGSTISYIRLGDLRDYPVAVAPPDQQKSIVAEIEKQFSRLDEAVANLKRVKANLKRYKAAVLKAAVEGKLTEDWRKAHPNVEPASKLLERILAERRAKWNGRGKYKEPIVPDTGNPSLLPEGWAWASVDQVAEVFLGKMLDKEKHRTGRQLPYLRNINVRWGRVDTDDLSEMFFENDELERYGLLSGDVLVCEGGEPGRAAVWDGRIPKLKYQKALHRVRFYGKTEPCYLVFLLEFLANTGRLERWFTGSTIKHFTRESFVSLPISLPPLAEQKEIVAEVERHLSIIEELEATVETNLTRADRLRQSILSQAFTGKLVCVNANESGQRSADIHRARA